MVWKGHLWPKRQFISQMKVMTKAEASLIGMDSVVLLHLTTRLSTSELGLRVSSFCLQDNNNTECFWLAQAAANRNARNESQGSHCTYLHLPDTLPGWAQTQHLITFPIQSKTEAHCVPWHTAVKVFLCVPESPGQRLRAMALANFQYITRMSSGFKVYILEGKLDYFFFFDHLMLLDFGDPLLW